MKSAALPISDDLDRRIVKASDPKFPIFVAPVTSSIIFIGVIGVIAFRISHFSRDPRFY
jgi:hypothetical protein